LLTHAQTGFTVNEQEDLMNTRQKGSALIMVLFLVATIGSLGAQTAGNLAPDQVPGVAIYVPYPVTIKLDGNLDDWKGVPVQKVTTGNKKGPDPKQNQYIDFSVAADDVNLYVYMHSEDANIIAGKHGKDYWNEDSLEFYFNLTGKPGLSAYGGGIFQITVNATNIGNTDVNALSLTGTNSESVKVSGKVFKTADGWAFEVAVPWGKFKPAHGLILGFQAHASGASTKDRDSKLIWSKNDTGDQSYQNPSLFGRAVIFKVGSTDVPPYKK
jgi:hypothetical protein